MPATGQAALGAAADEWGVGVVELAGDGTAACGAGNEFHLPDEGPSPGGVDAGAKINFHTGELRLPSGAIGGQFQTMIDAAERVRVRSELRAEDGWPGAFEPCESGVRVVDASNDVAEEISRAIHEGEILAQLRWPRRHRDAEARKTENGKRKTESHC